MQTLVEQWNSEHLLLPEIQREYVWDNGRASRLVESLLLNIPIPVLYFAETEDAKWEIFDGHQRVRSVVRYLGNEFRLNGLTVLSELKGKRFHQLPEREQRFLKNRMIRAVVISNDSHPNMKFEIFERLNTGAIILNAQELRNSLYRGSFNRLLHELTGDEDFRQGIGTERPRRRMADEEFILRFFALRAGLKDYRPPLKRFLNNYMRAHQNASDAKLDELRKVFEVTTADVSTVLGSGAFRVCDKRGRPLEKQPNRALFDAQMLAFSWATTDDLEPLRPKILEAFAELYDDEGFLDAIRLATGDRVRTLTRIRRAVAALEDAGAEVDAPAVLTE